MYLYLKGNSNPKWCSSKKEIHFTPKISQIHNLASHPKILILFEHFINITPNIRPMKIVFYKYFKMLVKCFLWWASTAMNVLTKSIEMFDRTRYLFLTKKYLLFWWAICIIFGQIHVLLWVYFFLFGVIIFRGTLLSKIGMFWNFLAVNI